LIASHTEVYVAIAPVNLHLSFDRLVAIVREQLGSEPSESAVYVFHNRPRTHVKILACDASGYWIHFKRLHRGTLRIPMAIPPGATRVTITHRELSLLLEGIDAAKLRAARRAVRSVPATR
jgi:transposase